MPFFQLFLYQIDEELSDHKPDMSFRELFSEAVQIDPGKKENGYVRIEFIETFDESAMAGRGSETSPLSN